MRIIKSILGIIGFMLFLMGVIYGEVMGAYLSTGSIFLMLYAFGGIKWLAKESGIKINIQSDLFIISSLIFIYLSFYEKNITTYNVVMAVFCTILSWLFTFYINIPQINLNIYESIEEKKEKYKNYKNPPRKLLNQTEITYTKEDYRKQINDFFKSFKLKLKYMDKIQNSYLITYKYKINSGIKIDDILELKQDLEIKLKTKVEITISNNESNIIYIKIPRKEISAYNLINIIEEKNKNITIPLGETDEGNKINLNLEKNSPLLLLGEVGTGKTNLLNIIITNIILNYTPKELNLILIDKQQTGLDLYNNIPHLALPLLNNPNEVLMYLDEINKEIERRQNIKEKHMPIVVIIDEIFDIKGEEEIIKNKLETLIVLGSKVGIYLIISTSTMNKTDLMDYLDTKINNKIYFYGRNIEEYNKYQNTLTPLKGIINIKIDNQETRMRTPKIEEKEIKEIVDNAKGLK